MVRSAPDGYSYKKWGILSQLDDPAEMASRILSGVSWIRTGDVIYYDDQSKGLGNHILICDGAGCSEVLDTGCWLYGGQSIELTTAAAITNRAFLRYVLPAVVSTRLGFEFNYYLGANPYAITLEIGKRGGGERSIGYLRYNASVSELQYFHGELGWTALVADLLAPAIALPAAYLKLAIDVENGLYIGAWHNREYYNLSTAPLEVYDNDDPQLIQGLITLQTDGVGAAVANIDKIVFTQNEL